MISKKTLQNILIVAFALFLLSLTKTNCFAQEAKKVTINKISFSKQGDLEITLSDKILFKTFVLKNPDRLVIDLENAEFTESTPKIILPSFASSWRKGMQKNSLRLVFDLNQKVDILKSSLQKLKEQNFAKIIVEISNPEIEQKSLSDKTQKVVNSDGTTTYVIKPSVNYALKDQQNNSNKKIIINRLPIIVIDAGHGGKDPGTIGDYARTKEKNITLAYAKELKKSLDNTKNYRVFLTRDDDFFIPLGQRVQKSRKLKADLFISLHANSIENPETSGFSIYTLSQKSSDKRAELLAQKENRADIINGVNFSNASPDIMKTLIDLSQRDSMNSSSRFANTVIKSVKKSEIKILQNTHRFAGFVVLTAPDVASVLIELGYLSNREEEKELNNLIYKRKIVASITSAVDEFFHKN
ncbi:MAG: N-acetylmuramoyl-L-alanine amidase [Proteobacteria bacterium]|nr:N-acetylmuramoyl-L-alanine amidase [Pseudomonadota bacterium]